MTGKKRVDLYFDIFAENSQVNTRICHFHFPLGSPLIRRSVANCALSVGPTDMVRRIRLDLRPRMAIETISPPNNAMRNPWLAESSSYYSPAG